jgi:hypothetical protein
MACSYNRIVERSKARKDATDRVVILMSLVGHLSRNLVAAEAFVLVNINRVSPI